MDSLFFVTKEYKRYIIGNFEDSDFAVNKLREYGEIYTDLKDDLKNMIKLMYTVGQWTIIPCPTTGLITRGLFLNLMAWLSQDGKEAVALALHPQNSYFACIDETNTTGDTVFVVFDTSDVVIWSLPDGLVHDDAYSITAPILEHLSKTCHEFLRSIDADQVIEQLKLAK